LLVPCSGVGFEGRGARAPSSKIARLDLWDRSIVSTAASEWTRWDTTAANHATARQSARPTGFLPARLGSWPWAFFLFALYGANKLMHAWPIRHPTGLSSYSIRKQILDNHQANNSIILNKSELFKRLTADFVGAPPPLTDDRGLCYEQGVRTLRTKPGLTARVMRSR
jgi:hypothetical protein